MENIKSNLIKNAYPQFLINKATKKYLDYKFSSNQNQLKDNIKLVFNSFKLFSSKKLARSKILNEWKTAFTTEY